MQSGVDVVNLFPYADGTQIASEWVKSGANYVWTLTGLDPTCDYTLQITITADWGASSARRFYMYNNTPSGSYINTVVTNAPVTQTMTRKPTEAGELHFSHNATALQNADYAASLVKIMLEVGSVAHPYVPYVEH